VFGCSGLQITNSGPGQSLRRFVPKFRQAMDKSSGISAFDDRNLGCLTGTGRTGPSVCSFITGTLKNLLF
jgi:hypothetical protein